MCFLKNSLIILYRQIPVLIPLPLIACRSVDEVVSEHIFNALERIVLTFFLASIIIMTVLGNLLVMVALSRDRQLRWGTSCQWYDPQTMTEWVYTDLSPVITCDSIQSGFTQQIMLELLKLFKCNYMSNIKWVKCHKNLTNVNILKWNNYTFYINCIDARG